MANSIASHTTDEIRGNTQYERPHMMIGLEDFELFRG